MNTQTYKLKDDYPHSSISCGAIVAFLTEMSLGILASHRLFDGIRLTLLGLFLATIAFIACLFAIYAVTSYIASLSHLKEKYRTAVIVCLHAFFSIALLICANGGFALTY